jgi:sporulation protein YunB
MGVIPMRRRHYRPKQRFRYAVGPAAAVRRVGTGLTLLMLLVGLGVFLAGAGVFFNKVSCQIAVSDASDIVTAEVNAVIADVMAEGEFEADSFMRFEKNDLGEITAVSSNMSRINALSAEILDRVVGATENRTLKVSVPLGNLTGISLLMGRGPGVPEEIIMMTSSHVEFQNNVVTAGINQTKHQINLEVIVDIDILIPWGTESAQVVTEVMIADVVVVGKVPETYLNMP